MALQLVYNDEQGITNNEAYARIGRIDVNSSYYLPYC